VAAMTIRFQEVLAGASMLVFVFSTILLSAMGDALFS
jgi:hypothetical protein